MPKLRNKFEKRIDKALKKAKVVYTYESEKIPYVLARHYIPDFILVIGGSKVYIELKGHLRREDKAKLKAVKTANPSMDLRILFYSRNKQYIKWAERNGIPYAIENIPEEWLSAKGTE